VLSAFGLCFVYRYPDVDFEISELAALAEKAFDAAFAVRHTSAYMLACVYMQRVLFVDSGGVCLKTR
jgi:hypothetical protein